MHALVDAAFDDPAVQAIVEIRRGAIGGPGWINSLSAKLIQLTIPGVPDVYQGSELWEQCLVDPDNRRPVDFELRTALLADARTPERPPAARRHRRGRSCSYVAVRCGCAATTPSCSRVYAPAAGDGDPRPACGRVRPRRRGRGRDPAAPGP